VRPESERIHRQLAALDFDWRLWAIQSDRGQPSKEVKGVQLFLSTRAHNTFQGARAGRDTETGIWFFFDGGPSLDGAKVSKPA